jgi:hypothetical protein
MAIFPEMSKWYFFAVSYGYIVTSREEDSVIFQMSDVMVTSRYPCEYNVKIILQRK